MKAGKWLHLALFFFNRRSISAESPHCFICLKSYALFLCIYLVKRDSALQIENTLHLSIESQDWHDRAASYRYPCNYILILNLACHQKVKIDQIAKTLAEGFIFFEGFGNIVDVPIQCAIKCPWQLSYNIKSVHEDYSRFPKMFFLQFNFFVYYVKRPELPKMKKKIDNSCRCLVWSKIIFVKWAKI